MTNAPQPQCVTIDTAAGSHRLPIAGAKYIAGLTPGMSLQILGALGAIGHEETARSWLWALDHHGGVALQLELLAQPQHEGEGSQIENRQSASIHSPGDSGDSAIAGGANLLEEQERARAHLARTWAKVEEIIIAARTALAKAELALPETHTAKDQGRSHS